MPKRIWVEDLGKYAVFPDNMSRADIEVELRKLIESKTDEGVNVGGALKHGLKSGFADMVDSLADYSEVSQKIGSLGFMDKIAEKVRGEGTQSEADIFREKLRKYAADFQAAANEKFTPEGYAEKTLSGMGALPGSLASMAPALAVTALTAPIAGPYAPAIGFGMQGAVRGVDEGLKGMATGGAVGAAEGLAFGGLGKALGPLAKVKPVTAKGLHALGGAGIAGGSTAGRSLAAGEEVDVRDVAANATVMGALGLAGLGTKKKTSADLIDAQLRKQGIEPTKPPAKPRDYTKELVPESDQLPEGTSFVDLAMINEVKGGVKPPHTRTNYEKMESPLVIDEIGWRELQGMAPEKRTISVQEMIDRAREVGDYETAATVHNRFMTEYGEGKLGGITARTKSLAYQYSAAAAVKRIQLDKAEMAGDVEAVQRLSQEYTEMCTKGMALTGFDTGYGESAGRTLRMRQEPATRATVTDEALEFAAKNDRLDVELYDRIIRAQSDAERMALAGARYDVKLQDKMHEAWVMGMLSNPLTWVVNFGSNTAKIPLRLSSEVAGVGADATISALRGTPRTKTLRDVRARIAGIKESGPAVMDAMKDLLVWKTYINDLNSPLASNKKIEMYGAKIGAQQGASPIETGAGSLIRTSGRVLQSTDNVFRSIAEFEEVFAMASERSGKKATATEISNLARSIMKDTEKSEPDLVRIKAAGDRAVFTDPLSKQKGILPMLGRFVQEVKSGTYDKQTRIAKWTARGIFPFTRTPTNIMIDALRHSPFGGIELYRMIRDGATQGQISSQIGSMLIGSSLMGIMAYYADQGRVTGGGPSDPRAYAAWRAAGNQPYSLRLTPDSKRWYSYQRIEPFASVMGAAADFVELGHTKKTGEAFKRSLSLIKDNLTNKTYMMGAENVLKAWADPERYGENWLESIVGSAIPASVSAVARVGDPINRSQVGPREAVMNRIPGLRQKLEPKYTITGDVSKRDHPVLSAVTPFSPVDLKPEKVVEAEMARLAQLGYSIPGLPRRTKKINRDPLAKSDNMNAAEYAVLMDWTRKATRILEPMISSPSWKKLDEQDQADIIKDVYEKMREPGSYDVLARMRERLGR